MGRERKLVLTGRIRAQKTADSCNTRTWAFFFLKEDGNLIRVDIKARKHQENELNAKIVALTKQTNKNNNNNNSKNSNYYWLFRHSQYTFSFLSSN